MSVLPKVLMYSAIALAIFVVGVLVFALCLSAIMKLSDICCNTNLFRRKRTPDTGCNAPNLSPDIASQTPRSRFAAECNESEHQHHMSDPITSYPTPASQQRRSRFHESSPVRTDTTQRAPEPRSPALQFSYIHIDDESDLPPSYNEAVNNPNSRNRK